MPKPHSQDLRDRVIEGVESAAIRRRAEAWRFGVGESLAVKWLERPERNDSREPSGLA
jgi:transposase